MALAKPRVASVVVVVSNVGGEVGGDAVCTDEDFVLPPRCRPPGLFLFTVPTAY